MTGNTLPPWSGNDEAMYRWCDEMLQEQIEKELSANATKFPTWEALMADEAIALHMARDGQLEPLRKLYPHLAPFLHPPSKRGKYRRDETQLKRAALDLVKRVKALWRIHYGRRKRGSGDGISANEIAARYLGLDEDQVALWVRKG